LIKKFKEGGICDDLNIDVRQISFIDSRLRDLLLWLATETNYIYTITSMYRIGDCGVHGTIPLRGIDLRCRDKENGEYVASVINEAWVYDPERPKYKCCVLHGKGAALHLHLQVHANTRRRDGYTILSNKIRILE
jgi:hypothetical protein